MTKFKECVAKVTRQAKKTGYPLRSASGVCAAIGRAKYGKRQFSAMAAAGRIRKNPIAEIYKWKRDTSGVLHIEYVDVDDGDGKIADGYVFRLFGDNSGTFEFMGAEYKRVRKHWHLKDTSKAIHGEVDLNRGVIFGSHDHLTDDAHRQLKVIFDWLVHEVKEHGHIPPRKRR